MKKAYVPSYERRKTRPVDAVEYENAALRRRLSDMSKALAAAEGALREALQWEAYVKQAFDQSARVGVSFFSKHAGTHKMVAEAVRRERTANARPSLYVQDPEYAKDQSHEA